MRVRRSNDQATVAENARSAATGADKLSEPLDCPARAQAYYQMKRAGGMGHHAAIRSLAYKWIRVLWRCWQDRTIYEEAKYLAALRKSGSPIIAWIQKNPAPVRPGRKGKRAAH
jgi:hypothetical protein